MELLGALEAEKSTKEKWKQYCGTPCSMHYELASRVILWQSDIYWGEIIRDLRDQNCPDYTKICKRSIQSSTRSIPGSICSSIEQRPIMSNTKTNVAKYCANNNNVKYYTKTNIVKDCTVKRPIFASAIQSQILSSSIHRQVVSSSIH